MAILLMALGNHFPPPYTYLSSVFLRHLDFLLQDEMYNYLLCFLYCVYFDVKGGKKEKNLCFLQYGFVKVNTM